MKIKLLSTLFLLVYNKWAGRCCNRFLHYYRGRGTTIHGTKDTILLDRNGYFVYDLKNNLIKEEKEAGESATMDIVGGGSLNDYHMNNFANAIRTGEQLNSPIREGVISTNLCHFVNISQKLGEIYTWILPQVKSSATARPCKCGKENMNLVGSHKV